MEAVHRIQQFADVHTVLGIQEFIKPAVVVQAEDGRFHVNDECDENEEHQLRRLPVAKQRVHETQIVLPVENVAEEAAQQLPGQLRKGQVVLLEVLQDGWVDLLQNLLYVLQHLCVSDREAVEQELQPVREQPVEHLKA